MKLDVAWFLLVVVLAFVGTAISIGLHNWVGWFLFGIVLGVLLGRLLFIYESERRYEDNEDSMTDGMIDDDNPN